MPYENILYRSLPYVPVLSSPRVVISDFSNVEITSKAINTTAKIINNNKDRLFSSVKCRKSNTMQQLSMAYIDMARNYLRLRMYEHQIDINKYNTMIPNGIDDIQQQMNIKGEHKALLEHIIKHKQKCNTRRAINK